MQRTGFRSSGPLPFEPTPLTTSNLSKSKREKFYETFTIYLYIRIRVIIRIKATHIFYILTYTHSYI